VERIIIGQGLKHLVTIAIPGEVVVATDAHPLLRTRGARLRDGGPPRSWRAT
jgi:hypothetical protein